MEQGGELSDTRGVVRSFIDGLEPESFVYVCMCVYVVGKGDYEALCLRCRLVRNEEPSEESQT